MTPKRLRSEAIYGLASKPEYRQNFAGIIWGTGIGGAFVTFLPDGGYLTECMEPGHFQVSSQRRQCNCGQMSCWEAFAGGASIEKRLKKPAAKLTKHEWGTRVLPFMVNGLRGVLTMHSVDLIIVSGGIPCHQEWTLKVLESKLTHPMLGSPMIRLSDFGESVGTLGALALLSL